MKKTAILLIICFIVISIASACRNHNTEENLITSDESARGINQLRLYVFDGETTTCFYLENSEDKDLILKELEKAPFYDDSDNFSLTQFPWYGLDIQFVSDQSENKSIAINRGAVFMMSEAMGEKRMEVKAEMKGRSPYQAETLLERYHWIEQNQSEGANSFPCAAQLLKNKYGWQTEYLSEANLLRNRTDLSVEIRQDAENRVIASVTYTGEDSEGTALDSLGIGILYVENQGKWFTVPYNHSPTFFAAGAYDVEIEPGKTKEFILDLDGYFGTLPNGHYRWSMMLDGSLCKEFTIGENNRIRF